MARIVSLALSLLALSSLIGISAADGPNQAGLVVQFGDGRVETRCVSFEGDQIMGADVLALSGLDAVVDPSSGMGITVCRIEGEGCSYPAEPCFCQCMSGGECAYWNYFFRDAGQADWTYSALGAAIHAIKPGSVEGWVWGDGHTPPDKEITFEVICPATTPGPTATSEQPAQATIPVPAGETANPTDLPTGVPAEITPSPRPTQPTPMPSPPLPAASPGPMQPEAEPASRPMGYLPFGLMVAALVLVGGLVWLRRR